MRNLFKDFRKKLYNKKFVMGSILVVMTVVFISIGIMFKTERISAETNDKQYFTNVSVSDGDTLWSVAQEYMDENHYESVYDYIDALKKLNSLTSDEIYSGQNLIVIYYSSN